MQGRMIKIRYFCKRLTHAEDAVALVEFTLILPLFILIIMGVTELALFFLAMNSIEKTNSLFAEQIGRMEQAMTESDINTVYSALTEINGGSALTSKVRIVVSSITYQGPPCRRARCDATINWSRCFGSLTSGDNSIRIPREIGRNHLDIARTSHVVVKTLFQYDPALFRTIVPARLVTRQHMSVFRTASVAPAINTGGTANSCATAPTVSYV